MAESPPKKPLLGGTGVWAEPAARRLPGLPPRLPALAAEDASGDAGALAHPGLRVPLTQPRPPPPGTRRAAPTPAGPLPLGAFMSTKRQFGAAAHATAAAAASAAAAAAAAQGPRADALRETLVHLIMDSAGPAHDIHAAAAAAAGSGGSSDDDAPAADDPTARFLLYLKYGVDAVNVGSLDDAWLEHVFARVDPALLRGTDALREDLSDEVRDDYLRGIKQVIIGLLPFALCLLACALCPCLVPFRAGGTGFVPFFDL